MCKNPSPSMASPPQNPNHTLTISTPKTLNPHASPFVKPETNSPSVMQQPSTPPKAENFLPRPFFPHEMLFRPQQPQLLRIPSVAHPLPVMPPPPPPSHAFICYPTSQHFYNQPYLSYPSVVATTVCYNTHKQPLPGENTVPYYVEHVVCKESFGSMVSAQPAVCNSVEKHNNHSHGQKEIGGFRCEGKKWKKQGTSVLKNKNIAPRFRSKMAARKMEDSCVGSSWVPKNLVTEKQNIGADSGGKPGKRSDDGSKSVVTAAHDGPNLEGKTSLMIRNIPNQFERHHLMHILDKHCLEENGKANLRSDPNKSEYDFLYLPMDFRRRANYGYAFVNFTNSAGAMRFTKSFQKHEWNVSVNKKTCEICSAVIQGKDALSVHFKNSVFPCHTNGYLPVVFSPPRDGFLPSKPYVIGRRGGAAAANLNKQTK